MRSFCSPPPPLLPVLFISASVSAFLFSQAAFIPLSELSVSATGAHRCHCVCVDGRACTMYVEHAGLSLQLRVCAAGIRKYKHKCQRGSFFTSLLMSTKTRGCVQCLGSDKCSPSGALMTHGDPARLPRLHFAAPVYNRDDMMAHEELQSKLSRLCFPAAISTGCLSPHQHL